MAVKRYPYERVLGVAGWECHGCHETLVYGENCCQLANVFPGHHYYCQACGDQFEEVRD